MGKNILKELNDLVRANVIPQETADKIQGYYNSKPGTTSGRLIIAFGILGSLLVGMGIVLILAHNWDLLSKPVKLFFGFLPLFMGQVVGGYLIIKKNQSKAWREGTAVFLFFAVAVSISIVSQVYNIEGSLAGFLLLWMALCILIPFVLGSSMSSLLYIVGITWYACEVSYFHYPDKIAWMYWLLLVPSILYYYREFVGKESQSNFYYFHSWLLAISLTITLAMFGENGEWIMITYMSLFSAFVLLSELKLFETDRIITNAWLVTGSLGMINLLMNLSFRNYWQSIQITHAIADHIPEVSAAATLTLLAAVLAVFVARKKPLWSFNPNAWAFLIFIALYGVGKIYPGLAQILVNLLVLVLAVHTILNGARKNHLGIMNYGLLIITALITCRFFDSDLSFVMRGLLFVAVGLGFFGVNYYMIQKRKRQT